MTDFPSSRYPSSAESYEFIKENWSAKIILAVTNSLVCANLVTRKYQDDLTLGDKVWIPVGSNLTAGDVDVTSDYGGNMNSDFGDTVESITIDTWKEVPVQIDDGTKRQTHIRDLEQILGTRAGYELAKAIDTAVNALFSSLTSTWAGSDGQAFTDDLVINLKEGLDEADVPAEGRVIVVDPSVVADIYKIDKFVHASYGAGSVAQTGNIGKLYGMPVYVTNNLTAASTGAYGAMFHPDCIGLCMQKTPTVESNRWAARHSDVINVSAMWGVDVVRSAFGAYFFTRKA